MRKKCTVLILLKLLNIIFAEDETKVHSKIPNPSNGGIEDPDANKKWQDKIELSLIALIDFNRKYFNKFEFLLIDIKQNIINIKLNTNLKLETSHKIRVKYITLASKLTEIKNTYGSSGSPYRLWQVLENYFDTEGNDFLIEISNEFSKNLNHYLLPFYKIKSLIKDAMQFINKHPNYPTEVMSLNQKRMTEIYNDKNIPDWAKDTVLQLMPGISLNAIASIEKLQPKNLDVKPNARVNILIRLSKFAKIHHNLK